MSAHGPATVTLQFSRSSSSWPDPCTVTLRPQAPSPGRFVCSVQWQVNSAPSPGAPIEEPPRRRPGSQWRQTGFKPATSSSKAFKFVRSAGLGVFEAASSRLGAGYPQGSLSRVPLATWERYFYCFLSRCQRHLQNERRNQCESVLGGGARGHPPLGGCSKRHSHSAFGTKLQSLKRRDLC
jgi:hypothetical protein